MRMRHRLLPPGGDRRRRNWIVTVLVALLVIFAVLAWDGARHSLNEHTVILGESARGSVALYPGGSRRPETLKPGQALRAGDQVATGTDGGAALRLPEDGAVALTRGTLLRIGALGYEPAFARRTREFALQAGRICIRTGAIRRGSAFTVNTPSWRIESAGGRFSVYLTPITNPRYPPGTLVVASVDADLTLTRQNPSQTVRLTAGQAITLPPRLETPPAPRSISAEEERAFSEVSGMMKPETGYPAFRLAVTHFEQRFPLRWWSWATRALGMGEPKSGAAVDAERLNLARSVGEQLRRALNHAALTGAGYPSTLNFLDLSPLQLRSGERRRILSGMDGRRLEGYQSSRRIFRATFRATDSRRTLVTVTKDAVVIVGQPGQNPAR